MGRRGSRREPGEAPTLYPVACSPHATSSGATYLLLQSVLGIAIDALERVAEIGGVLFVNDSKATNVEAAARAIESFERLVVIMGGRFKGGDLGSLNALLARRCATVTVGVHQGGGSTDQSRWSVGRRPALA